MADTSKCKNCGQELHWHVSNKTQKKYPCNSPDRRDFHKCAGRETVSPAVQAAPAHHDHAVQAAWHQAPPPVQSGAGIKPFLEAKVNELDRRVYELESKFKALSRGGQAAQSSAITRQNPITDFDVEF